MTRKGTIKKISVVVSRYSSRVMQLTTKQISIKFLHTMGLNKYILGL